MDSFISLDFTSLLAVGDDGPGGMPLAAPTPNGEDDWQLPLEFEHSSSPLSGPKFFCVIA